MTGLSIAVVLQAALLGADSEDYSEARKIVTETGKPMVVMVGADWCPACETMKQRVLPRIRERGALRKVVFALVDLDRDRDLGRELTGGGPIPQLVMYRKTSDGWLRTKLVGAHSAETVESFIQEGVKSDEEAKQAQSGTQDGTAPE